MFDKLPFHGFLFLAFVVSVTALRCQDEPALVLRGHEHPIRALVFSPDGKWLYSGSEDTKVLRWDLEASARRSAKPAFRVISQGNGYVGSLACAPDGKLLAAGAYDGRLRVWEAKRFKKKREFGDHGELITALAWHPESPLLASGTAKTLQLWNTKTGKSEWSVAAHEHWITALAISPSGEHIASGGHDKAVHVWEIASGKKLVTCSEKRLGMIFSIAWYPSGKDLILAGQATAFVRWNVATNASSTLFRGHTDLVKKVAFRPDGKMIASLGKDRTVRLWEPDSGRLLATWKAHDSEPNALAWSPDGKRIATGARDEEIRIWTVPEVESADEAQDASKD